MLFGVCLDRTLLCFVFLQLACVLQSALVDNDERQEFVEFMKRYNKSYTNDTDELEYRYGIFQETLKRIKGLNQFRPHAKFAFYGITQYADLTPSEFHSKVLKHNSFRSKGRDSGRTIDHSTSRRKRSVNTITSTIPLPSKFDWRDRKVVTAIKNQGDCGACWAFTNIETIETMYAIKTGELPVLSVQQIIDCALNGNYGCQGGDTCSTLVWLNSTKVHVVTEEEYPFIHATGQCKMKDPPHGVQVQSFTCKDYRNNENAMVSLIASHGPLVVAVDATMWQDYLGGIIKYHCETIHNHAVQIVGYDLTGPVPYFIVRNSWGTEFGLNGYLHIAIGKDLCGEANVILLKFYATRVQKVFVVKNTFPFVGIAREVATVDVI